MVFHSCVHLSPNLLTVTKSASRNGGYFCQQIYWLSPNLLAEMGGLFLLADLLTVTKSASRFTDCHEICGRNWGVFLPADLLTATKSAGRNGSVIPAGRFTDCHQICLADLLMVIKSAAKMGGGLFLQQIYWLSPNLPVLSKLFLVSLAGEWIQKSFTKDQLTGTCINSQRCLHDIHYFTC